MGLLLGDGCFQTGTHSIDLVEECDNACLPFLKALPNLRNAPLPLLRLCAGARLLGHGLVWRRIGWSGRTYVWGEWECWLGSFIFATAFLTVFDRHSQGSRTSGCDLVRFSQCWQVQWIQPSVTRPSSIQPLFRVSPSMG